MRRIVVTGANKGIGLAIVQSILEGHGDTFVYLGSRSAERGIAAVQALVTAHPGWAERISLLQIDVSDSESVTRAAGEVPGPVYGLVNNAGIAQGPLANIIAVNVAGVRQVCDAFLPKLQEGGRVVNVSSASGPNFVATRDAATQRLLTDPDSWDTVDAYLTRCLAQEETDGTFSASAMSNGGSYGLSKALVNAYTILWARENPGLHINACTPGFIETDLTRAFAVALGRTPQEMGMKPPADGARSTVHLLFGELSGNGWYYGSDAVRSPMHRYRSPGDPPYTGE